MRQTTFILEIHELRFARRINNKHTHGTMRHTILEIELRIPYDPIIDDAMKNEYDADDDEEGFACELRSDVYYFRYFILENFAKFHGLPWAM